MQENEKAQYRQAFKEGAQKEAHKELQNLMRTVVKTHIDEPGGTQNIYKLFSDIYDDVFLDMYNKKIDLKRKTRHMLEMLSLPHTHRPYEERIKLYHDIIENRTYYQRKPKAENTDEEAEAANS